MNPVAVSTYDQFRNVYRKVCGSTKTHVDQKLAYSVMAACGKTVITSHLQSEWPFNTKKVGVDRLFDIYNRLGDLCIEPQELEMMKKRKLTAFEVLQSLADNQLINMLAVEDYLSDFTTDNGYIDIEKMVHETQQTRDELLDMVLDTNVHDVSVRSEADNSQFIEPIPPSAPPMVHVVDETELIGKERPLAAHIRGHLAISPRLQSITSKIFVDHPTECEIVLSVVKNSDIPSEHFDNDLFLIIYDKERRLLGITRFWLNNGRVSTGDITIEKDCELMVICTGTSLNTRKSNRERLALLDEERKLTKRFKMTLMNIFESFDVNQDGVLDRKELDFYTQASGDSPLLDEEWNLYYENFDHRDNGITLEGFLKMHQIEASDSGEGVINDLWKSLNFLGYDTELMSIYGCPYDIAIYSDGAVNVQPSFHFVTKEDRNFLLEKLYELGEEQTSSELLPHLFQAEYFGLMIAKKKEQFFERTFRLVINKEENIRWNFPHSVNDIIRFRDSDNEWVLMASYTANKKIHDLQIALEDL